MLCATNAASARAVMRAAAMPGAGSIVWAFMLAPDLSATANIAIVNIVTRRVFNNGNINCKYVAPRAILSGSIKTYSEQIVYILTPWIWVGTLWNPRKLESPETFGPIQRYVTLIARLYIT